MPNRAVLPKEEEIQFQPQPTSNPKSKKWIWIGAGLLTTPVIIIALVGMIAVFGVIIIATEDGGSNSLSEYGTGMIPPEFIPVYQEAGKKYGVDWILLAAIHKVETDFSQNVAVSSAGAIGHTQFMKCTWIGWGYNGCSNTEESVYTDLNIIEQYNGYGVDANGNGKADPYEIEDAINATAKYLAANMAGETEEEKMRNAVYAYNHADWYVDEVMNYYNLFSTNAYSGNVTAEIIGENAWPVPHTKRISSPYGMRDGVQHKGIDISEPGFDDTGQPVVAFADGTVTFSQYNGGFGNLVIIDHGNGVQTYYGHLAEQGIPAGTQVKAGQMIGKVGDTGNSYGAHLHFEIRVNGSAVDPIPYVQKFLE